MKKFLIAAASVVLAAATCVGVSACGKESTDPKSVNLVVASTTGTDANFVGRLEDVSYYVLPEPAATAQSKRLTAAGTTYSIVGDLQELYGGEDGYPQAVMVAKSSLIESDGKFVTEFLSAYANTATWIAAQTDYTTIVNKIVAAGASETSLSAAALNTTSVAGCNIKFVPAQTDKQNVIDYMNSVQEVDGNMYGECVDAFFQDTTAISTTTEDTSKTTVSVYMPEGAPSLSMAYMMSDDVTTLSKTVSYNVVTASTINTHVNNTDETKNADICVLPVTAAAKLLGNGTKGYKLLGTVTHGNLYIISRDSTPITKDNIASKLNGQSVGVVNLSAVPGLTFRMVLKKYSVNYTMPE